MTAADPHDRKSALGRPGVTSHAVIERVAFALFAEKGFEATTLDDIAREVGVGKRTLFRYFASKNDIPWGQFDLTLAAFRRILAETPPGLPLHEAVRRGVAAFNDFPADAEPPHATRMRLILETPALQAHSALKYAEWRSVVAAFAADRRGEPVEALVPELLGHLALGISLAAYGTWLREGGRDAASLLALIEVAFASMGELFGSEGV